MKLIEIKNPGGIRLTKSNTDGIWLHFEIDGKNSGGIRIDDPLFPHRTDWAERQFAKAEGKEQ